MRFREALEDPQRKSRRREASGLNEPDAQGAQSLLRVVDNLCICSCAQAVWLRPNKPKPRATAISARASR